MAVCKELNLEVKAGSKILKTTKIQWLQIWIIFIILF